MKIKDDAVIQRIIGLSKTAKKMMITAMENLEKDCGKENLEKLGWSETDIHYLLSVVLNAMYIALGLPKSQYKKTVERFCSFLKETDFSYNGNSDDDGNDDDNINNFNFNLN